MDEDIDEANTRRVGDGVGGDIAEVAVDEVSG
jgi:hypothetical protein